MEQRDDFAGLAGAALVTGATGGIGAAVSRLLGARGSDVALFYGRNDAVAGAITDELGAAGRRASAFAVALEDDEGVAAGVAAVAEQFGGIHTVVHAAGPHVPQVHLSRIPPVDVAQQLAMDVMGFVHVVHHSLPHLRQTAGSIVAVTTAATRRYPVRDSLSAIPKASVEAVVRAVAAEEGRFGVRANSVGPGMLTDGMAERLIESGDLGPDALEAARGNIALRRFGTAVDVAEAVCFLASRRAAFISGQFLDVDGGYGV